MHHYDSLDAFLTDFADLAAAMKDKLAGHPGQFQLETKQGRRMVGRIDEDGKVTVSDTPVGNLDCSVVADETDLLAIINGTLPPMKAILTGRARIHGNPLKLMNLIKLI